MAELFRIETERVSFVLSGPRSRITANAEGLPSGHLRIVPRKPGFNLEPSTRRAGVPDLAASELTQVAGPPIFEETSYTVLLTSRRGETVELRHRDPVLVGRLDTNHDGTQQYGTINFRSQVGLTRFHVSVGARHAFDVELEVFPSKLEYRADYASMMADVQDLAAGLALEYLRSTHQLSGVSGTHEGSRLDWIALLRHVVDELEQAVDQIVRRPLKALRRQARMVRVEALRRSDSSVRKAVRGGAGRGPRITLSSGVPVRRYLPERRPESTLDTPEHRWLATQLEQVRLRLAKITNEEDDRQQQLPRYGRPIPARDRKALEELTTLEARIARLERVEPLAAAEGRPPSGFTSLRLQNTAGYQEAYRSLLILRLGLRISGGPVELSVKDVHLLYEYWCFLGIIRLVAEVLQTPIPADALLEIRTDGLRINLQQGRAQSVPFQLSGGRSLQVTYNPSFNDPDALLEQKPDIVLTLVDPQWPTVRLVLDAKYRVEDGKAFVERFGAPGPPPDAVNVLHRYRDAILESDGASADSASLERRRTVIEGAVLYPLSAETAATFDESRFWTSLERLGIGALPFLPGSRAWLEQWLRGVLQRSGWDVADAVISHAAEEREAHWKQAAERVVLIGVLRGVSPAEHLAWIRSTGIYYAPLTSQARQLATTRMALYEPASMNEDGEPGRVRLWAPVEQIEVMTRRDIDTPWPPRKGKDDLHVVYRLGDVRELESAVLNRSGQRFSGNRWSSALALERARTITELLLESMIEWRFYDALRARGADFQIRAVPPTEDVGRTGRAWFVVGDRRRVRWRGGADFALSVKGTISVVDLAGALEALSIGGGGL